MLWEELNTKRYYKTINDIISLRGQWSPTYDRDGNEIPHVNHHIKPRCKGGYPNHYNNDTKHDNLVWLTNEEHYLVHKILNEDTDDYQLKFAFVRMSFDSRNIYVSAEEYAAAQLANSEATKKRWLEKSTEEKSIQINKQKQTWSRKFEDKEFFENFRQLKSENVKGTHWYNNGNIEIMSKICPEGFVMGRLPMDNISKKKLSITASKLWSDKEKRKQLSITMSKVKDEYKKKVLCVELKKEYESIKEASREMKTSSSHIRLSLNNKTRTCRGYHWEYHL